MYVVCVNVNFDSVGVDIIVKDVFLVNFVIICVVLCYLFLCGSVYIMFFNVVDLLVIDFRYLEYFLDLEV